MKKASDIKKVRKTKKHSCAQLLLLLYIYFYKKTIKYNKINEHILVE